MSSVFNTSDHQSTTNLSATDLSTSVPTITVYIVLPLKNPEDEQEGTGDVDYVLAIEENLNLYNKLYCGLYNVDIRVKYLRNIRHEDEVYDYINKEKITSPTENISLHIFWNEQRTINIFSENGLRRFKAAGGKIISTVIEFYKYSVENSHCKTNTLRALKFSDKIIFLDEFDKLEAGRYACFTPEFQKEDRLRSKLLDASVIAVPATVPPKTSAPSVSLKALKAPSKTETVNEIIVVIPTMIRRGKGYEHVLAAAQLVKNTENPKMKNIKFIVAGTVQEHDKENKELHMLMLATYSKSLSSLFNITYMPRSSNSDTSGSDNHPNSDQPDNPDRARPLDTISIKELKQCLKQLKELESQGLIKPELPIDIRVDLRPEEFSELYLHCDYVWLPFFRGATLRNSSFCTALAHNCLIISHIGQITDKRLLPWGEYDSAMIFISAADSKNHFYAEAVLNVILARIEYPGLNDTTKWMATKLYEEVIHPEVIAKQHATIYVSQIIPEPILYQNSFQKESKLQNEIKAKEESKKLAWHKANHSKLKRLFLSWKNIIQEKRTSFIMEGIHGADLRTINENAWAALVEKTRVLALLPPEQFPADMARFLKEKPNSAFQAESQFMKNFTWCAQHLAEDIKGIVESGGKMLSYEERTWKGSRINRLNTLYVEGHENSSFYTLIPKAPLPKGTIPKENFQPDNHLSPFFSNVDTIIELDISKLGYSTFQRCWVSDTVVTYHTEFVHAARSVFGCIIWESHRKIIEPTGKVLYKKFRHFLHPTTGQTFVDEINLTDEFFVFPYSLVALKYIALNIIRYMGLSVWEKVLKLEPKEQEHLFQLLFGSRHLEMHVQSSLNIYELGVLVRKRIPDYMPTSLEEWEKAKKLIFAALEGKEDVVLKALKEDPDIINLINALHALPERVQHDSQKETKTQEHQAQTKEQNFISLAAAILINANPEVVIELLEHEVDFNMPVLKIIIHEKPVPINLLELFLLLTNPDHLESCYSILSKETFKKTRIADESNFENASKILSLILEKGTAFKKNTHLRSLPQVTARTIILALRFKVNPKLILQLLSQAKALSLRDLKLDNELLLKQPIEIISALIKHPVKLDEYSCEIYLPTSGNPRFDLTPLLFATANGNYPLTELLLSQKANLEKTVVSKIKDILPRCISFYEGMTPLLLAVSYGYLPIIELLLKNGANPLHKNALGHNAYSIAKYKKRDDILKILRDYRKDIPLEKELTKQLPPFQEVRTFYILTGVPKNRDRFFTTIKRKPGKVDDYPFYYYFKDIPFEDNTFLSDISEKLGISLSSNEVIKHDLGTYSYTDNRVLRYQSRFVLIDLGVRSEAFFNRVIFKTHPKKELNFVPLYASQILRNAERNKRFEDIFDLFIHDHGTLPFVARLLILLAETNDYTHFIKNHARKLQALYNRWWENQLAFSKAAREGNIEGMRELLETELVNMQYPLPVALSMPEKKEQEEPKKLEEPKNLEEPKKLEAPKKPIGIPETLETPLETALRHDEFDAAWFLISQAVDHKVYEGDESPETRALGLRILKAGHFELYRCLEFNFKLTLPDFEMVLQLPVTDETDETLGPMMSQIPPEDDECIHRVLLLLFQHKKQEVFNYIVENCRFFDDEVIKILNKAYLEKNEEMIKFITETFLTMKATSIDDEYIQSMIKYGCLNLFKLLHENGKITVTEYTLELALQIKGENEKRENGKHENETGKNGRNDRNDQNDNNNDGFLLYIYQALGLEDIDQKQDQDQNQSNQSDKPDIVSLSKAFLKQFYNAKDRGDEKWAVEQRSTQRHAYPTI